METAGHTPIILDSLLSGPRVFVRDRVFYEGDITDRELLALGKPRVLFSSSASLYATVDGFEVTEDSPLAPGSPYARTKQVMEMVLTDMAAATDLRAIILRYFNPIGSDPDLESGIYAREPSHVLGQIVMAAQG